jgi:hypothetical protein
VCSRCGRKRQTSPPYLAGRPARQPNGSRFTAHGSRAPTSAARARTMASLRRRVGTGAAVVLHPAVLDGGQNQVSNVGRRRRTWLVLSVSALFVGGGWTARVRQRQRDTELTSIHVRLPSNQSVGLGRALACRNREVRNGRGKVTCEAREARRPRGFGADGRPCAAGDGCDGERIIIGRRDGEKKKETEKNFGEEDGKDLGTESKRKRWVTGR